MVSIRLSVVMPTHNRAHEVADAVHAILSQRVPELELVVVDDASSDATPDVLDRLAARDDRVRVVRNDASLGAAGARNRGVAQATGELVAFCDDDDRWLPGAGETVVEYLDCHPGVGAVSAWHEVLHVGHERGVAFRGPLVYGAEHLLWYNVVAIPFLVVRRSAFAADPWSDPDPALATAEDWDRCLRCAQERPIATIPSVLYQFRQHGGQRLTKGIAGHQRSRRTFVERHGAEMTPACRMYHEAILELQDGHRSALAARLARAVPTRPQPGGLRLHADPLDRRCRSGGSGTVGPGAPGAHRVCAAEPVPRRHWLSPMSRRPSAASPDPCRQFL